MAQRRFNPLAREWVLVSPHRTDRPWLGERSQPATAPALRYDPTCYLCPGNERAGGQRNPQYTSQYVFVNDYPALTHESRRSFDSGSCAQEDEILVAQEVQGECRVVCFSPRHDLHLGSMDECQIAGIVDCWTTQYGELGALPFVNAVTIFENRGAVMGASNPHPHGQIWAESSIPNELAKESLSLRDRQRDRGECLLCSYAAFEIERQERVVYADDRTVVVVPYWATWPFEAMILGRSHRGSLAEYDPAERSSLAGAMKALIVQYDRLFGVPFPYSMGFHQSPTDGEKHPEWHAHAHYYPPLLRSATVRKYMVGYEMLAQPQRDLTAEAAAKHLRDA
ncbi:MAG TPA: UDP-glucose--hexose-1-phosphate uridylyltransferase [Candidatus Baltobacteraceae bacterium]|jgi:UDPglucose--hexose-1-phosphate uridylyltransferase|nr:UDP-glucose--hexose-1-phosphate uridylyltransferase [Candidatus Baltobacteraceae bacterium]